MHGVKRSRIPPVPDSEEVERKKREKELKKIAEYKGIMEELQAKAAAKDYTQETLDLTTRILSLNPEFQTGWGIRRRVLLNGLLKDADAATKQCILESDLQLTNASLKLNPKNYSVWEHRKWVLETMPDADWGMEMKMVELYLEKDGRNFHSWDYRRYLISSILALSSSSSSSDPSFQRTKPLPQPTTESELAFTTRKISANFSNFSAWHYRTKMLAKLWAEKGWGPEAEERLKRVDEEFDLVKQAIWSDPNDQSAWLYHRWLVGEGTVLIVRREIEGIEELLEEEPDSRWCLDSLVYYKRLLVSLLEPEGASTQQERDELNLSCVGMLKKLEEVDPMRGARYRDLGIALWLCPASESSSTALTTLISELSTKYLTPSFPPHVTLLSSIPSTTPLDEVLSRLTTALSAFRASHPSPSSSVSLPLAAPGTRGTYFQYVFAAVSPTPALLALRKAASDAFFPDLKGKGDDYFPHLSLVYGRDSADGMRSAARIILELVTGGEVQCLPVEGEAAQGEGKEEGEGGEKWAYRGVEEVGVVEVKVVKCDGLPEEWKVLGSVPL
ncbi:hypothetical protein JCM6882_000673 [Rhodosporidiobolus microsporus]